MMKPFIALALAVVFSLSLVACSSPAPAASGSDVTSSTAAPSVASSVPAESTASSEAPAASGPAFEKGTWNGNVYTSNFSQLTFTLPEGWVSASDEEMAQIFSTGMESMDVDSAMQQTANEQSLNELFVTDPTTGTNISIIYENLSGVIIGSLIDEATYAEMALQQVAAQGISIQKGELKTTTIGGNTYTYMENIVTGQGYDIPQTLVLRKIGDYMLTLTLSRSSDETTEELLAYFS